MGAVDRNGYRFEPEYSIISQKGAIHVSKNGKLIEEIQFHFNGDYPELDQIEEIIDTYCEKHNI